MYTLVNAFTKYFADLFQKYILDFLHSAVLHLLGIAVQGGLILRIPQVPFELLCYVKGDHYHN